MQRFIALYASFGIALEAEYMDGYISRRYKIELGRNTDILGQSDSDCDSSVTFDEKGKFMNQAFYVYG